MNEHYQLLTEQFISPTSAGAYFCVSGNKDVTSRRVLQLLMMQKKTSNIDVNELIDKTGLASEEELFNLLNRMQTLGWLEGKEEQSSAPQGGIEELLPDLLVGLADSGKALLADEQGFYLSSQGFPHETAEELSALSADLSSLYDRHQGLLKNNLGLETSAWAIVDASGNGQIGFWPLWVGKHRFVLIVKGVPLLNQTVFMTLIWVLSIRYGE
ncbi:MAG: hypothetical protein GQ475_05120 [Methylococcaceae bacterium]|nr:hypothetical protein [Methylococcaceae bacterium]